MISLCIKENNSKIIDYIVSEVKKCKISEIYYSTHSFRIYDNVILHYKGENFDDFFNFVANTLANLILIFYEPVLVKKILNLNYFYFSIDDKNVIYEEYNMLNKKNKKTANIKLILKPLKEYLQSNKSIVIEGFVNFRLQNYIHRLDLLVEQSVNQFIVDKEYIEFVNLLKNYVSSKVPDDSVVNLIYVNSEGILLSDDGKIIDLEKFDSRYLSDVSFSNNDYVLNTLVGLLPSKIILHLISPRDQFIKTVELIFEKKVELCTGCELCNAYNLLNLR